ncbi:MAG: hypothetical protein PHF25_08835 [Candidatus Margulisbacteria bacterium]|nr:hypothetical protein [Candidatus Margulisiibacteriota bacterium]
MTDKWRCLSIFKVVRAQIKQGPVKLDNCTTKKYTCSDMKNCILRKKIEKIRKFIVEELKSVTIASAMHAGKETTEIEI